MAKEQRRNLTLIIYETDYDSNDNFSPDVNFFKSNLAKINL